jgi:tetratricopeptide (TPR) repeat protein
VKAIQLDTLLADAHDALGRVYARDGQWELSERSFRRAIQLDRNRSTTYDYFVIEVLLPLGRIEEALKQLRVAEKADPLSPDVHYFLYYVLNSAGRYDEASGHCNQLPTDFWARAGCRSEAQIRQGRIAAAIQSLETEFHSGGWRRSAVRGFLGCAYMRAGRREEAEKIAAASSDEPFTEAKIFACLGDKDRAFQALDRAAAAGPTRMGRALTFPEFALLRGDPRVKDLRRKVGLPE